MAFPFPETLLHHNTGITVDTVVFETASVVVAALSTVFSSLSVWTAVMRIPLSRK